MQAKEMPPDDAAFKDIVAVRVLTVLRRLRKRGAVVKHKARHKLRRPMGANADAGT
jgi:hypothetical protein